MSCMRFSNVPLVKVAMPVMLPPGWLRLWTSPRLDRIVACGHDNGNRRERRLGFHESLGGHRHDEIDTEID